jgi:hypothetical protein
MSTSKRKSAKAETQRRIRIIQDWLLQDHVTTDIINNAVASWNISERQAYRYLWAAGKFFKESIRKSMEDKVNYYLARKRKLLRDMDPNEKKTAAGVKAINSVLDSMAKMEGITIDSVKVIGDPAKPIHTRNETAVTTSSIDYSKLPTEFLHTLVAARNN